jgi:hypothetical protein
MADVMTRPFQKSFLQGEYVSVRKEGKCVFVFFPLVVFSFLVVIAFSFRPAPAAAGRRLGSSA